MPFGYDNIIFIYTFAIFEIVFLSCWMSDFTVHFHQSHFNMSQASVFSLQIIDFFCLH